MRNRICLITGGSRGIGKAAADGLATLGTHVVIVARDPQRGARAATEIRALSGNGEVDVLVADLSVQAQVRGLAETVMTQYDRLDVLVNNAGAVFTRRRVSADGIEMTLALNHLAPFLLTGCLLPMVTSGQPGRIITVSSEVHRGGALDERDLQNERGYRGFAVYSQSKLANVLFTYELSRRLAGTRVDANCLHPGFVSTGFGKNTTGFLRFGLTLIGPFLTQPERGADNTIYLASSPDVEGVTGKYFVKREAVASSPASYDEHIAGWLWDVSARMTGLPVA